MIKLALLFMNADTVRLDLASRELRGRMPRNKFGPSFIGHWCGNVVVF